MLSLDGFMVSPTSEMKSYIHYSIYNWGTQYLSKNKSTLVNPSCSSQVLVTFLVSGVGGRAAALKYTFITYMHSD